MARPENSGQHSCGFSLISRARVRNVQVSIKSRMNLYTMCAIPSAPAVRKPPSRRAHAHHSPADLPCACRREQRCSSACARISKAKSSSEKT